MQCGDRPEEGLGGAPTPNPESHSPSPYRGANTYVHSRRIQAVVDSRSSLIVWSSLFLTQHVVVGRSRGDVLVARPGGDAADVRRASGAAGETSAGETSAGESTAGESTAGESTAGKPPAGESAAGQGAAGKGAAAAVRAAIGTAEAAEAAERTKTCVPISQWERGEPVRSCCVVAY